MFESERYMLLIQGALVGLLSANADRPATHIASQAIEVADACEKILVEREPKKKTKK